MLEEIHYNYKVTKIDIFKEMLNWFDYWLKGKENNTNKEDPVKIFLMGKNEWRTHGDWPIPGTKFKNYYINFFWTNE